MEKAFLTRKELFGILRKRMVLTGFGILIGLIMIIIPILIFAGTIKYDFKLWHAVLYAFLLLFVHKSVSTILDVVLVDLTYIKCKNVKFSLSIKKTIYYIEYTGEDGKVNKIELDIPEGAKRHFTYQTLKDKEMYLIYTTRSYIFIGLKCIDKTGEFKDGLFLEIQH